MNVNFSIKGNGDIVAVATPYTPDEIAARLASGKGKSEKGNISLASGSTKVLVGDKIVEIRLNAYYSSAD